MTTLNVPLRPADGTAQPQTAAPNPSREASSIVPIRAIGARHREHVATHLLALDERDRYLRFGYAATDDQIRAYVDGLNFERDTVFGIFNRRLQLIALAHLAYPAEFVRAGMVEFGVSVSKYARGRGYGALLFDRAALCAVNADVDTLLIHALSENAVMLRIASNAGAVVERHGSESEARLRLPAASLKTRLHELLADHVGHVDYWLKTEAFNRRHVLATVQEVRQGVGEALRRTGR